MIENNENFENQLTNEELIEIAQREIKRNKVNIAFGTVIALSSAALGVAGFVMGNYKAGGICSGVSALNICLTCTSIKNIKDLKNYVQMIQEYDISELNKIYENVKNNEAEMQDKDVFPDIYSDKKEQSI